MTPYYQDDLVTTGLRISEALGLMWSSVDFGGNDEPRSGVLARSSVRDGVGPVHVAARPRAGGSTAGPSLTVRHQLARENGEWVRCQPKTAKGRRTIPLTPLGVEALRAQKAMQLADLGEHPVPIDGLVFTSTTGHPLHGTNTVKALAADLAAAGLPHVTQHDLRHSCATLLYSMGLPMPAIADILGHADARITEQLYRHHVKAFSVEAADKMQAVLG